MTDEKNNADIMPEISQETVTQKINLALVKNTRSVGIGMIVIGILGILVPNLIGIAFNVIMNYWLIPHFGYMVSAYITLFTYFLTTLLIYLVSSYYHQIKYEWVRIIIPLFVVVAMHYLKVYVDITNLITFAQKIFITFTLLLFIIFFWLDKSEKLVFKNFIKKLT